MVERHDTSYSCFARVLGLGMLLAFLGLSTACEEKRTFVTPPPPTVTVSQPVQREITVYREFTGNTQAINTVQLVARVEGYLEKVLFQDGEYVKKGQLLFIIQQDTYEDKVKQSEAMLLSNRARLEYAETEFARYSQLFKQNAAAATDVSNWKYQRDSAKSAVMSGEAELELSKLNLSYTKVTAPFDGRVDRRLKDPGNLVGNGGTTPLVNINQIDPIYVYFTMSENDLMNVILKRKTQGAITKLPNMPADLGLASEDGYPREGRLDFAAITLDPSSGTLLMRAVFPNPDRSVLPGMFARIRLPYLKGAKAMLVPEVALGSDQLGHYVLVVNDRNVVERRAIETGPTVDEMLVVEKGLNGDESVIVNGLLEAIPGREVKPVRQPVSSPASNPQQSKAP